MEGRYLHRLPGGRPVNRERYLIEASSGRSVIHIGFADHPLLDERIASGTWLHSQLNEVARSLVGIDIDREDCEWAAARGFDVRCADASSEQEVAALGITADLVIAGEVIEHLDAPGPFLRAMHHLGEMLIVTTPNAYRPLNMLAAFIGKEVVHSDHTAWHSPATLRRLLTMSGWAVEEFRYYRNPSDELETGRGMKRALLGLAANGARQIGRARPYWSDGLIAVSSSAEH